MDCYKRQRNQANPNKQTGNDRSLKDLEMCRATNDMMQNY